MTICIGENIKRLRLAKQITQEQLSLTMGVSCAAVSKWERAETLPDITLLPILANYFGVSIDELMGYDADGIEKEIQNYFELRQQLRQQGKMKECIELSQKAYWLYSYDLRVANQYMWDMAGDYADNDASFLLEKKEEFSKICHRILEESKDIGLRLDAVNMQAKLLYAEGKQQQAVELYQNEFPDWYCTRGQKIEQLFLKSSSEFARQLRMNLLELGAFMVNKKCKELWFCRNLSETEKEEAVMRIINAMEGLCDIPFMNEIVYYIYCFANDMAGKFMAQGEETPIAKNLASIAQRAKKEFCQLGEKDSIIKEYCEIHIKNQR